MSVLFPSTDSMSVSSFTNSIKFISKSSKKFASHYDLPGDYYTDRASVNTFINELSASHYDLSGGYCTNKAPANNFINNFPASHYDLSGGYYTNKATVSTSLSGKQATITGAATTVTSSNLTANRVFTVKYKWQNFSKRHDSNNIYLT